MLWHHCWLNKNESKKKSFKMKLTQYHQIMKTKILLLAIVLCFTLPGVKVSANSDGSPAIKVEKAQKEMSLKSLAHTLQLQYQSSQAKENTGETVITADSRTAAEQHLFLLANGISAAEDQDVADWRITIGRDIYVPVINSKNPFAAQIASAGLSAGSLAKICRGEPVYAPNGDPVQFHFYCSALPDEVSILANFLQINPQDIPASVQTTELLQKIENDPMSLGFVKLSTVSAAMEQNQQLAFQFAPIDRNGNGKIDHTENFYGSVQDIERAAWLGKFPRQLTNPYFLATQGEPSEEQIEFVLFAQQQGQLVMQQAGIGMLPPIELKSNVGKLINNPPTVVNPGFSFDWIRILFPVAGLLLILLLLGSIYLNRNAKPAVHAPSALISDPMFEDKKLEAPAGLLYDRTHTWTLMQREGLVKIGIADFLLHITGSFSKIKAREIGQEIQKGEQIVSLWQNGKELVLYAPVSGIIKSVNMKLLHDVSALSHSPYSEGWIYEIEPTNWAIENRLMMMVDAYRTWIRSEFVRLRDFFATNQQKISNPQLVMQDGGEMKKAVLRECGPEVWENFQTNFINPSR